CGRSPSGLHFFGLFVRLLEFTSFFLSKTCCFGTSFFGQSNSLTLVVPSTFALTLSVAPRVDAPGPLVIHTLNQASDPGGDRFYSLFNTLNTSQQSYQLSSGPDNTATISFTIPPLFNRRISDHLVYGHSFTPL
ncbi:hypothetical protein DFH09DRAFT_1276036, partial [Mycena vulgaris]